MQAVMKFLIAPCCMLSAWTLYCDTCWLAKAECIYLAWE